MSGGELQPLIRRENSIRVTRAVSQLLRTMFPFAFGAGTLLLRWLIKSCRYVREHSSGVSVYGFFSQRQRQDESVVADLVAS